MSDELLRNELKNMNVSLLNESNVAAGPTIRALLDILIRIEDVRILGARDITWLMAMERAKRAGAGEMARAGARAVFKGTDEEYEKLREKGTRGILGGARRNNRKKTRRHKHKKPRTHRRRR